MRHMVQSPAVRATRLDFWPAFRSVNISRDLKRLGSVGSQTRIKLHRPMSAHGADMSALRVNGILFFNICLIYNRFKQAYFCDNMLIKIHENTVIFISDRVQVIQSGYDI